MNVNLSTLRKFEENATVREILAADMHVNPDQVEQVLDSQGGYNWIRSIAYKFRPVRSNYSIKKAILSNLDLKAHFKITDVWAANYIDTFVNSDLMFDDEDIRIQIIWNILTEGNDNE